VPVARALTWRTPAHTRAGVVRVERTPERVQQGDRPPEPRLPPVMGPHALTFVAGWLA
jgi:hypothetical protein